MSQARIPAYMHIEGWEQFDRNLDFNKRKIRAGMRKAGKLVAAQAQMSVALSRGAEGYPVSRTGRLVDSIRYKVSRPGFMVKIAPQKTAGMAEFYPAYLHYGVKAGPRVKALAAGQGRGKSNRRGRGERQAAEAARQATGWRIAPRANYMVDALDDSAGRVRAILTKAFERSLFQ